ncbi:hypothetical protein [Laspinema olomoucense]|uniref:hypothetical protein n=1 Tax=Laspinema olomoucense TaxID=3231600 RepID=UPI0021BA8A44|nr:hypothetical protein [Laspinema sp. D3c]MCT7993021.1 hypothetical protein [Laspinema sp. D3c]
MCHNTEINWVKALVKILRQDPDYQEIPEVSQIDELQIYVDKQNKVCVDCCH